MLLRIDDSNFFWEWTSVPIVAQITELQLSKKLVRFSVNEMKTLRIKGTNKKITTFKSGSANIVAKVGKINYVCKVKVQRGDKSGENKDEIV